MRSGEYGEGVGEVQKELMSSRKWNREEWITVVGRKGWAISGGIIGEAGETGVRQKEEGSERMASRGCVTGTSELRGLE